MAPDSQRKTILSLSSAGEAAANEKNGIKLTWSKVTGAEGYRIYRGNSGGEETTLKTVTSTVTAYTDKTVVSANGKSYTYTVQPYSGQWDGSSEGVSTVRLTGVTLKKAAKAGSGIKLTWTRNSKAKGYEIYRKMNGGKWTKVKTITKNSTLSCVDKAVKHGKTYSYKVCAYKDTSTSQLSNTKTVKEVAGMDIQQCVIGSCTNGRISDLRVAAKVMEGKKVADGVRCIVIPATQDVYMQALKEGLIETFITAGAVVSTPTCGPCLGGHMGVLYAGERAISTTNRNFVGRMGHVKSEVVLSSPAVAAASAVKGTVCTPDDL